MNINQKASKPPAVPYRSGRPSTLEYERIETKPIHKSCNPSYCLLIQDIEAQNSHLSSAPNYPENPKESKIIHNKQVSSQIIVDSQSLSRKDLYKHTKNHKTKRRSLQISRFRSHKSSNFNLKTVNNSFLIGSINLETQKTVRDAVFTTKNKEKLRINQNNTQQINRKISLKDNLRINTQTKILDFPEALHYYNQLQISFLDRPQNLWRENRLKNFFCCFSPADIEDQDYEACEKLVSFAYLPFSSKDILHKSLLISAYATLAPIKHKLNTPDDILPHCQSLNLTSGSVLQNFLNILFLDHYFYIDFKTILDYCATYKLNLYDICLEITGITIEYLREKRLNSLISKSKKCLEVVFLSSPGFFFTFLSAFMLGTLKKK
jgi:hypothetical protein